MIAFVANSLSGVTGWQNWWRRMSCRYLASQVSPPSGVTEPDFSSIDALLAVGGVKFFWNRGQGEATSSTVYPRSDDLLPAIIESVDIALDNNLNNPTRPISGINVNVEPSGSQAFLQRVGPGIDVALDDFSWISSSEFERRAIREELAKSFPGVLTYTRENVDEGEFVGTQPTYSQTHEAIINWYTGAEGTIRSRNGSATGLLVSQWWKTPNPYPFFGRGWWGSGPFPGSQCSSSNQLNLPNCWAFSSRHDWLGRRNRDYDAATDTFPENTTAPDEAGWASNGWAAAVETYAEQFYANSVGVLGTADIMPLQWYSMPYTEAATAANLDVATTNGFVRAFTTRFQPLSEVIENRKANIRASWRAASERYGDKVAIGSRWMVDSNSSGWLGAWAPPDLWREIIDYAFEPYPGSIAPKHIAMWSSAGFLDVLFQTGTATPSADLAASRRVTLQRFAGRSSVGVDWDISSSQGKEWRFALASMFDEDTYERVLVAKGCIARARTRHAARASTLDAGGIVIGQ